MRTASNLVNTDFTGMPAEYVNKVNAEQYNLLLPVIEALCLKQGCLFKEHLLLLIEIITTVYYNNNCYCTCSLPGI